MPKIEKELKAAIIGMPEQEKDKLLLRLIAKDEMLVKRLHHELLEDEFDMEEQRDALKAQIKQHMQQETAFYYNHTPGLLMMLMRDLNGAITRHVKVTKDKYGEVELTLTLLEEAIIYHKDMLEQFEYASKKADTFARYFCRRMAFVLNKLKRMDRDFYMEFEPSVNTALSFIHSYNPTSMENKEHQFPKKWEF